VAVPEVAEVAEAVEAVEVAEAAVGVVVDGVVATEIKELEVHSSSPFEQEE